ncbi:methyltransferase domain-containing protein [soil metagenome]
MNLNKEFWSARYRENSTGWDLGEISQPLKTYIDKITNKELKILIPGGGNSYEAEYLFSGGFKNVFVIDLAVEPLQNLKSRCPGFPDKNILHGDFFDLAGKFDLILEQTFFCALPRNLRGKYVEKTWDLLNPGGCLSGVLFNIQFPQEGPPFGGDQTEYSELFGEKFKIKVLEICYNSNSPRLGNELFIIFKKNKPHV